MSFWIESDGKMQEAMMAAMTRPSKFPHRVSIYAKSFTVADDVFVEANLYIARDMGLRKRYSWNGLSNLVTTSVTPTLAVRIPYEFRTEDHAMIFKLWASNQPNIVAVTYNT